MALIMHTGFLGKEGLQNSLSVKLTALKQNMENMEALLLNVRKIMDSTNVVHISEYNILFL